MLRSLSEGRSGEVRWPSGRLWVVGESTMSGVTGIVRGSRPSASILYLPNSGDHQATKVRSSLPVDRHVSADGSCLLDHVPSCNGIRTPQGRVATEIGPQVLSEPPWLIP